MQKKLFSLSYNSGFLTLVTYSFNLFLQFFGDSYTLFAPPDQQSIFGTQGQDNYRLECFLRCLLIKFSQCGALSGFRLWSHRVEWSGMFIFLAPFLEWHLGWLLRLSLQWVSNSLLLGFCNFSFPPSFLSWEWLRLWYHITILYGSSILQAQWLSMVVKTPSWNYPNLRELSVLKIFPTHPIIYQLLVFVWIPLFQHMTELCF